MTAAIAYVRRQGPASCRTERAKMAIARALSDTMPIACEGKNLWNGKRKPVTLVNRVVARNRAVQPSSLFPVSNPYATTIPEKIPIKLNTTCTKVSVVMPKIIMPPSSFSRPNGSVPHSLDRFLLMRDVHVAAVTSNAATPESNSRVRLCADKSDSLRFRSSREDSAALIVSPSRPFDHTGEFPLQDTPQHDDTPRGAMERVIIGFSSIFRIGLCWLRYSSGNGSKISVTVIS